MVADRLNQQKVLLSAACTAALLRQIPRLLTAYAGSQRQSRNFTKIEIVPN